MIYNLIGYYSLSNGCDSNCKSEIKNEENCPECYDEQGKISQNEYCNRKCITEDNNEPDGVCLDMCNSGNTDALCSLVNGVERLISENSDDLYIKKIKKTVDAFKDNCSSKKSTQITTSSIQSSTTTTAKPISKCESFMKQNCRGTIGTNSGNCISCALNKDYKKYCTDNELDEICS